MTDHLLADAEAQGPAVPEPGELGAYTDEELLALGVSEGLLPNSADGLWSGDVLEAVRSTALRSLLVRGCAVVLPAPDRGHGVLAGLPVRVAAAGPLGVALRIRTASPFACLVEVRTPVTTTSSALHLTADRAFVLQETALEGGVRRFGLRTLDGLGVELLAELALAEGTRAAGRGDLDLSAAIELRRAADGLAPGPATPVPPDLTAALDEPVHVAVLSMAAAGERASVALTIVHGAGPGWCLLEAGADDDSAGGRVRVLPWADVPGADLVQACIDGSLPGRLQLLV